MIRGTLMLMVMDGKSMEGGDIWKILQHNTIIDESISI